MKTTRTFFMILALVGFLFSLTIHIMALLKLSPSSDYWTLAPFLIAVVTWITAARLSGAKPVRMGLIHYSEVVKNCPTWLKRSDYFLSGYTFLIYLYLVVRWAPDFFHWRKVDLPVQLGIAVFSAFSMSSYGGSFAMLFGKVFGENSQQ